MNQKVIEWCATVLSILGAILNAFLIKEGFYLWIASNSLWIIFAVKNKYWGMVLTFSTFLIISVIGIVYWSR